MADSATSPSTALLSQPSLESWGRAVGSAAARGDLPLPLVVALRGPLGAGKSVLARAIARGAGVSSRMPSPTYNLLFTYEADGLVVHHLDLYRLEAPDDVWELGWEELGQGAELVLIEWPERAERLLPEDRWEVRLGMPGDGAAAGHRRGDDAAAEAAEAPAAEAVEAAVEPAIEPAALRTVRVDRVGAVPEPPSLPTGGVGPDRGRAS